MSAITDKWIQENAAMISKASEETESPKRMISYDDFEDDISNLHEALIAAFEQSAKELQDELPRPDEKRRLRYENVGDFDYLKIATTRFASIVTAMHWYYQLQERLEKRLWNGPHVLIKETEKE